VLNQLFGVTLWCKTLVLRKDKVTHCFIIFYENDIMCAFHLYTVQKCVIIIYIAMLSGVLYKTLCMYAVGDTQLVHLVFMVHIEVRWMKLTTIMHFRIHWMLGLEHVSLFCGFLIIEQPRF